MTERRRPERHKQAAAEELAVAALAFIAAEPERLDRFLAMSGIGPDWIRAAASQPRFLAGVLEHITSDEALLLAFAAEKTIGPEAVMRACETLAGRSWESDTP